MIPTVKSYNERVVIRTLVLSAKVETPRTTAIERIFPEMISKPMITMKNVRITINDSGKPEGAVVVVVFIVSLLIVQQSKAKHVHQQTGLQQAGLQLLYARQKTIRAY